MTAEQEAACCVAWARDLAQLREQRRWRAIGLVVSVGASAALWALITLPWWAL